jgi:YrbI family 3-deoxy-D-manno-octulosonate 8-phosphate phosphatase
MKRQILAIIPARGGSKGLPRKNVRPFNGVPLVGMTIWQALQSKAVSRAVVSTDDGEIGEVALKFGAEVVWRPPEISGDEASSESALLHALDKLKDEEAYEPDIVAFLQCTSPIRYPGDIDSAIETFLSSNADSLLSVVPSHRFLWTRAEERVTSVNYDFTRRPRRQDRPPEFLENGSIYLFKPWVLRQCHNRLGGRIALFEMNPSTAFEIDTELDFELAQWIASRHRVPSPAASRLRRVRLLVLDFDGVMTDNRVLVTEEGKEAVWCNRADGMGIDLIGKKGLPVIVLSREENPVVAERCRKLKIPSFQGIDNKLGFLIAHCQELGLPLHSVAYVGNDINDVECMEAVGLPVAVADAHPAVQKAARIVLSAPGGRGAVRELCNLLLADEEGS